MFRQCFRHRTGAVGYERTPPHPRPRRSVPARSGRSLNQIRIPRRSQGDLKQAPRALRAVASPAWSSPWPRCRWRWPRTSTPTSRRPNGWSATRPRKGPRSCSFPSCSRGRTSARTCSPSTSTGPVRSTATRPSSTSASVAAELEVVLPLSVYERANRATYNSVVVVDADGTVLGTYRKSHIPDGPGYTEKYYFNPGDTGFRVWPTRLRHRRRRHLLGPVVPGVGPLHGPARRRRAVLPDRHRQRAARSRLGLQRTLAAGDAGPRRRQPHAPRGGQPDRPRGRRDDRDHVLRVVVHRRRHRRQGGRGRPRRRGGAGGDVRPRRRPARPPLVGSLPRPPARPLRSPAHARRHDPGRHDPPHAGGDRRARAHRDVLAGAAGAVRRADARGRGGPRRGRPHDRRVRAGDDDRRAGLPARPPRSSAGPSVEVVELPIDDSWFRDTGPIYVLSADGARRVALDWVFNGWGEKYPPWDDDDAIARRWAEAAGHELRSVPMVLEGGSITVDGEGTLVTTEQCLLHPNRNPSLTRRRHRGRLREELGVATIVWLPHGLALDDDTDGHVDNVAAFARPGRARRPGLRRRGRGRLAAVRRQPPLRARCARRRGAAARGRRGPRAAVHRRSPAAGSPCRT